MDLDIFRKAQQLGENNTVEFKRCGNEVEHDVFESVCAFANRFGGDVYLGVLNDGTVVGVNAANCEAMMRNVVNAVNNPNIIRPSIYVEIDSFDVDGLRVIRIHVPVSGDVHTVKGDYYDRRGDVDVRVTSNEQISDMFIRKRGILTERKVFPSVTVDDLRMDMLPTLRREAQNKLDAGKIHPWSRLDDYELLKSAGLYVEDPVTKERGFNLAAVLLLGKDYTIVNHCPQYQTDALYRVVNVDRYDDRLLLKTNLLDSYEQLMAFAASHLPDPFYLEKGKRISLRYILTREMISNILTHREFTSTAASQFVIERERMFTINPCRAFHDGVLARGDITPRPKNPIIAGFFREVGRADQLGSGVKNLYCYAKEYGGGDPEIIESDTFTISVSLKSLNSIRFAFGGSADHKESVDSEEVSAESEKWGVALEKWGVTREKWGVALGKWGADPRTWGVPQFVKKVSPVRQPMRGHVAELFLAVGFSEVFGTQAAMGILGCGKSVADRILQKLREMDLLEPVIGHGKGKYRFRPFESGEN